MEDIMEEVYAYLESMGDDIHSDDFSWYGSFCKVVGEYVHGKLTVREIMEATDKFSDLLVKGLPGFQVLPLPENDRIRGQMRAMEWLPATKGKLDNAEKEALAFCVYYAWCIRVFDEKTQSLISPFRDFESKAKIDAEYNNMKHDGLHDDMFKDKPLFTPTGKFGFEVTNPIMCVSVPMEYEYLKHLVPEKGTIVNRERRGSCHSELGICDVWDIDVKSGFFGSVKSYRIYICPYGNENSSSAPEGFRIS